MAHLKSGIFFSHCYLPTCLFISATYSNWRLISSSSIVSIILFCRTGTVDIKPSTTTLVPFENESLLLLWIDCASPCKKTWNELFDIKIKVMKHQFLFLILNALVLNEVLCYLIVNIIYLYNIIFLYEFYRAAKC